MKELIFICLLALSMIFAANQKSYSTGNELKEDKYFNPSFIITNSYEHVQIAGIWWTYEYDEDGKLVNVFLEED